MTASVALSTSFPRSAGLFASVSFAPIWTALPFWMARIVCFSVTWMISWPSTSASSASFFISESAPRVMWM